MNYKYYNPRKAALDTARELLTGALNAAVADGSLPEAPLPEFIVEIPADVKNGDIASNAAMAGARAFHKAPRQIAQAIVDHLNLEGSLFDRVEIAGPGFCSWVPTGLPACCRLLPLSRNTAARTAVQASATTLNLFPPTPPAPCTWAMPAAVLWATAWLPAWTGPVMM